MDPAMLHRRLSVVSTTSVQSKVGVQKYALLRNWLGVEQ